MRKHLVDRDNSEEVESLGMAYVQCILSVVRTRKKAYGRWRSRRFYEVLFAKYDHDTGRVLLEPHHIPETHLSHCEDMLLSFWDDINKEFSASKRNLALNRRYISSPAFREFWKNQLDELRAVSLQVRRHARSPPPSFSEILPEIELQFTPPPLLVDTNLLHCFSSIISSHLRVIGWRSRFDSNAITRLKSPTGWLNGECINGCLKLLMEYFPNERCAVLSSFLIPMVRDTLDTDLIVRRLYQTSYKTKFWTKDTWVLPIHRRESQHWVLCTVRFRTSSIQLFDSFALDAPWQEDLRYITIIINTLVQGATHQGYFLGVGTTWTAYPTQLTACQANGADCGIWTLLQATAVLRGFDAIANVEEGDIPNVRKFLLYLSGNV